MKIKQVTNLLVHVKNRFVPKQSPALKQAAGLTLQSGLKAGASYQPTNGSQQPYADGITMLSLFSELMDDS